MVYWESDCCSGEALLDQEMMMKLDRSSTLALVGHRHRFGMFFEF